MHVCSVLAAVLGLLSTFVWSQPIRHGLVENQDIFRYQNVLPDEQSGALFAYNQDVVVADKDTFKAWMRDHVPDTVPEEVKCEKVKRCDSKGVCAIICKPGSVFMSPWLQQALKLQRKLAYQRSFCTAQLPGSHNSAINIADGYGVEDHVFEGYLQYFAWFKPNMHVHTNDQLFSLTDQLQMGVRFLELDVHWFNNDLRIAHCGGFQSDLLDQLINAFNAIAKLIGTDIEWDSSTIGCKPSLSSIPASEERSVATALEEIATWLHAPENKDEFLMIFFDDELNLMKWKKVGTLLTYIKKYFNETELLIPSDFVHGSSWPVFQNLIKIGKRIMFMSGSDYSPLGDEILFIKESICNWKEPGLPFIPYPTCRFTHSQIGPLDERETIFRPQTSEIEYGFLNADGNIGSNKYLLNEESIPHVVDCGVNLPSPDNITPKRMESTVWTVKPNQTLHNDQCIAVMRGSTMWQNVACDHPNMVAACMDIQNSSSWSLSDKAVAESVAGVSCISQAPWIQYSAPASGYENKLVYNLLQHASLSVAGVWVNAREFVKEVYAPSNTPTTTIAATMEIGEKDASRLFAQVEEVLAVE